MPAALTLTVANMIHVNTAQLPQALANRLFMQCGPFRHTAAQSEDAPHDLAELQQYAGRLHREHTMKTDVRIIDFVDAGHPALLRMWDKRQRSYRAMGYRVLPEFDSLRSDAPMMHTAKQ